MEYFRKISKLKIFRHPYKDPLEFYNHVLSLPIKVASFTGIDVLKPNYKKCTWNFFGLLLMILVFTFVTITTAYEIRHSIEDLIYCFVTIGFALQLVMKIYTHLYYRNELLWIQEYTKKMIEAETKNHKSILMGYIEVLNVIAKMIPLAYISWAFVMLAITLLSKPKTLVFGFWLPFIDRYTWTGYIINMAMQLWMSFCVSSECISLDSIYFMTVMCSGMQIDLTKIKLHIVNDKIVHADPSAQKCLHEIFKRHNEHLEFVRTIEKIYRSYYFITFSTVGAALVLVFYAVVVLRWYTGIGNGIFIIYELFIFCFMATLLEIKKEELEREIYNMSWYQWPIKHKQELRFMLAAAQHPNRLTMIFYPLNMPTFTSVINTIYSIVTLLLTFRNK